MGRIFNVLIILASILIGIFWGFWDVLPMPYFLLSISGLFFRILSLVAIPLLVTSIVSSTPVLLRSRRIPFVLLRMLVWTVGIIIVLFFLLLIIHYATVNRVQINDVEKDAILQLVDPFDDTISIAQSKKLSFNQGPFSKLLSVIPDNIFSSLVLNNIISIIFFSLMFGAVLGAIRSNTSHFLINLFDSFHSAFIKLFRALLYLLPFTLVVETVHFIKINKVYFSTYFSSTWVILLYLLLVIAFFLVAAFVISFYSKLKLSRVTYSLSLLGVVLFAGHSIFLALPGLIDFFERLKKNTEKERSLFITSRFIVPLLLSMFSVGGFVLFFAFSNFSYYIMGTTIHLSDMLTVFGKGFRFLFPIDTGASLQVTASHVFAALGVNADLFSRVFVLFYNALFPLLVVVSALVIFSIVLGASRSCRMMVLESIPHVSDKSIVEEYAGMGRQETIQDSGPVETSVGNFMQKDVDSEEAGQTTPITNVVKLEDKKKTGPIRRGIPFRYSFILITVGLLFGYALVSGWINYEGGRYSILSFTEVVIGGLSDDIAKEVKDVFSRAEATAGHVQYVLNKGVTDYKDFRDITSFFTSEVLEKNKDIIGAFIGTQDGNFYMSKRMRDESISLRKIVRGEDKVVSTWQHQNKDFAITFPNQTFDSRSGYDPRERPWYQAVTQLGNKPAWTKVYIFASEKMLGVSYALPVFNKNGSLYGVIGFDISLRGLSYFLSQQRLLGSDRIFIFEKQSKDLIAVSFDTPDVDEYLYQDVPETKAFDPKRIKIDETSDEILREAYTAFQNGQTVESLQSSSAIARILFNSANFLSKGSKKTSIDIFTATLRSDNYYMLFNDLDLSLYDTWTLGFIVNKDELLQYVNRNNLIQVLTVIIVFIVVMIIGLWFATKISTPLLSIAVDMDNICHLNINQHPPARSFIYEVNEIDSALGRMKKGLLFFKKYVPGDIVGQLLSEDIDEGLEGQYRRVTLFFSDVENFSAKSEHKDPGLILNQLGECLEVMTDVITKSGGTIDKYIGDSIMCFWGAPKKLDNHAERACTAAIRCQEELLKVSHNPFHTTRIGLHTGKVLVGNMGSSQRINYTVFGDEVNFASRLEGINKFYHTNIIISEFCYEEAKDVAVVRLLDKMTVKGRTSDTVIYELLGLRGEELLFGREYEKNRVQEFLALYWEGTRHYQERAWGQAASCFARAYKLIPSDRPVKLLYARSYHFYHNEPPPEWSGTVHY